MHAVVAGVGLVGQAQRGPVLEHHVAQRALGSHGRVSGAQHCTQVVIKTSSLMLNSGRTKKDKGKEETQKGPLLTLATEISPCEVFGGELNHIVVDGGSRSHKLATHGHEESVEHVDLGLVLVLDGAAVESAAELHLVGTVPDSIQAISIHAQVLASIHSVEHKVISKSSLPRETELVLELVSRDRNLSRLQDGGLGGNSIVVLVNVHTSINLLTSELALADNLDALAQQGA